MNKIDIFENKTLKLQNVISVSFSMDADNNREETEYSLEVDKIKNFIKTHGGKQIGPLIQYTSVKINDNIDPSVTVKFLLQSDRYFHSVEDGFQIDAVLKVKKCLYARFCGPEEKLKLAYDKLGVYAFENDIELQGCNYTVYVDRNEESDTIVADVFMPVKQD